MGEEQRSLVLHSPDAALLEETERLQRQNKPLKRYGRRT